MMDDGGHGVFMTVVGFVRVVFDAYMVVKFLVDDSKECNYNLRGLSYRRYPNSIPYVI